MRRGARLSDSERRRLTRERDALARAIRQHPIQVTYGRGQDMSLSEYIAAIKRRDEIKALLARIF